MGTRTESKTYTVERPAALVLITAPTAEPVSLASLKEYLRLTENDQDDTITELIAAAREELEGFLGRAILSQTFDLILDCFPAYCQRTPDAEIEIPRSRLSSVTSVKYYDTAGALQTWESSNYRVDVASEPGRITPAYGVSWPSVRAMTGAIQVRFVAASWASASAVPANIKVWIKARAAHLFNMRGQAITGTSVSELPNIDHLVEPYRLRRFT